jgi:hypothetical protein
MNRARHDDYLLLFFNANHEVVDVNPHIEPGIRNILNSREFILDTRFKNKPIDILEITSSWFVTKKRIT